MSVLIDSSVFYAAVDSGEQRRKRAQQILRELARDGDPFTTDHVLVETWLLIRNRLGFHRATDFWLGLRDTPTAIETVSSADLAVAAAIPGRWGDQTFSIVDCTSFAVMERVGCSRAATFDQDFAIYRYGPGRKKAFEVLG